MKTMTLEIPIENLLHTESIMLIAPMYDSEKGWGYVMGPIPRELLQSECPSLFSIVDESIAFYQEEANEA